jgi:hypothetical protein
MSGISRNGQVSWRKSSRSAGNGACVEVAFTGDSVAVRDSKDPDGAVLLFSSPSWQSFVDAIRHGELDRP